MSYVSLATPIGPWIAPTLALCSIVFFRILQRHTRDHDLLLATGSGSIGGIIATAMAFSLPTLFFLDYSTFIHWMTHPTKFVLYTGSLCLIASWYGLWIADLLEDQLIVREKLQFPIGQMTYKIISTQHDMRKAYELFASFVATTLFCMAQTGIGHIKSIIPKAVRILPALQLHSLSIPPVIFDLSPMLWAIGFVTGHVIAVPLAIGAISKVFVMEPIRTIIFSTLQPIEFQFAFCTGLVFFSTLNSFWSVRKNFSKKPKLSALALRIRTWTTWLRAMAKEHAVETICLFISLISFLTYFGFAPAVQLYLATLTLIFTRQIALIAGRAGIAPLGTFATFVMVPALFLFRLSSVQIVIIAAFVEICGGVAADVLFNRMMARLGNIESARMKRYQYWGIAVTTLAIGSIFWLLINKFSLGSAQLCAYKAQSRALLIQVHNVNGYALLIGMLFGALINYLRINPSLVLGGLLMPLTTSLGLIFGGMLANITPDRERWQPAWSGVFAAHSLWMLLQTLL